MFCPRCGKQLKQIFLDAGYCPSCGTTLHTDGLKNRDKKPKKPLIVGLAVLALVVVIVVVVYGVFGSSKAENDPLSGTWTASMKSTNENGSESYKGNATLTIKGSDAEVDAHFYMGNMEFWGKIRGSLELEGMQDRARVYSVKAQEAEWQAHDTVFSSDEVVNLINSSAVKLYIPEDALGDDFGAGSWGMQLGRSADYGTFSDTMVLSLYTPDESTDRTSIARFGSLNGGRYEDWKSGVGRMNIFYQGSWNSSVQKALFGEMYTANIELSNNGESNPSSISIEIVKK